MAVTQLKDGRWVCYYRVRDPGSAKSRVKREYFGRDAVAESAARKRNQELDLKKRRPPREQTGPTFGALAETYINLRGFSENSENVLKYKLQANILPSLGHRSAINITYHDLDVYVARRRKKGVTDSTISRELTDIKAILNFGVARRPPLIPFNPVRDYKKPPENNAIIQPPTLDETNRILAVASPHLIRAVLLSYYLGLRPGAVELLSLTWRSVNWENMSILVLSAHKGGAEKRLVPIHVGLGPKLQQWHIEDAKSENGPIIHYHGRPVRKIKTAWKGTLQRAGISRRLRPYDLRHHFVTRALEEGADIKALSEIVGSRPETLMRHYQHVTGEIHRRTIAKIPSLDIQNIPKKMKKASLKNRPNSLKSFGRHEGI